MVYGCTTVVHMESMWPYIDHSGVLSQIHGQLARTTGRLVYMDHNVIVLLELFVIS